MYQGNLNYITNCIIIWWTVVSLTRLWVWRGQIWKGCLPSRRLVYWEKCSHKSADIQEQTSDRCIIGNWKDLLKGSMGYALKGKQEPREPGHDGAWGLLKPIKQKLWGIKLGRLPTETMEYLVKPCGWWGATEDLKEVRYDEICIFN